MTSNTRTHIALALRKSIDDLAGKWAEVIYPYYESQDSTLDELRQKSKVAIEVLASILETGDFASYSNFYRKLSLEWISIGGNISQLRELKAKFLEILANRFAFLDIVEDSPQPLLEEIDIFLEKELWHHVASEYLEVYESEIGDRARALPDSNESLKQLLKLTGRLGAIFDAGDIWEELLHEMRDIFPSMDAGAIFFFKNGKLILKGICGFEDFVIIRNNADIDFGFYDELARISGIRAHKITSADDASKLVFYRRDLKDSQTKIYPTHIMSFPLVSEDTRHGLVCLYAFDKDKFFSDDELEMINILSSNLKRALIRHQTIRNLKESRRDGEFLIDLQKRLSEPREPSELGDSFLRAIERHIGHTRSVIYLLDSVSGTLLPLASHNTLDDPNTVDISALYSFTLERKVPVYLSSLKDNPILSGILPPAELVRNDEQGSLGIIPLTAAGEIEGLWAFTIPDISELSENKRLFLSLATSIFTYSLKDILSYLQIKQQHEARGREINLAANFQQDLTPEYFRGSGYEMEISLIPGSDLAGDFAFLDLKNEDNLILAIGDVSGRGIMAGMSMMSTYGLLGEFSKTLSSPSSILERLNNRLREQFDKALNTNMDEIFVTCFLISAASDGSIRYAKAGHHPPILCQNEGGTSEIDNIKGVPLGIFADSVYEEQKTRLKPGDSLVLYTDGITETRNEKGEEFGTDRLIEIVNRWKNYPPRIIQGMIAYQLARFIPQAVHGDDRTWIVIGREKDGWVEFHLPAESDKKKPTLTDVVDYIKKSKIVHDTGVYSHVLNESLRHAKERGQSEMIVRVLSDDESIHITIKDHDTALRGLEYPVMNPDSNLKFPQKRKAIFLLREVVDFLWYNNYAKEINLYQRIRGDQAYDTR